MPHEQAPHCRTTRRGDGHSKCTAADPSSNRSKRKRGFATRASKGTLTK